MKNCKLIILLAASVCANTQAGLYTYDYSGPAVSIPDGNLSGWSDTHTFSGLPSAIQSVALTLNTSGGYNGDLYAYLSYGGVLLPLVNRVGVGTGTGLSIFGFSASGLNVILSDTGSQNIHAVSAPTSGNTYAPDGRAVSPLSAVSSFDAAPAATFASSFGSMNPNGTWTLFMADVSGGGGQSVLLGWSLDVTAVPEPVNLALGCFAGVFLIASLVRSHGARKLFRVS